MEKNQIFENIMSRTSVRSYTDMPVEPEKVEIMLRAGMAAPSACNKQPWHFVVINDRDILDQIPQFSPYASMVKQATARHRGLRMSGQDAGRHRAGVLDSRLFGSHGEHSADGSRPGTRRCMDSPLSSERTIQGNTATAASAQENDSAQHPHHRISEESGGSKG